MGVNMSDIYSSDKRSKIMARVKGTDTQLEIKVRKTLFSLGYRFRKNDRRLPGKPDIVLPKYKCVIFINGCFWHGHKNCTKASIPKTRTEWWKKKINETIERDKANVEKLQLLGWKVLTVWECDLKRDYLECINKLVNELVDD